MVPTAYFLDESGKTIKQVEVGDKNLDELTVLFAENEFTPTIKKVTFPDEPIARVTVGTHTYEFYNVPSYFDDAQEFAENRNHNGEKGYLLTVTSPEEAEFLSIWLGENRVGSVWLGAKDAQQEGEWKWIGGPEKDQVFWSGGSVDNKFSSWNEGEPNNAGEEDCGVFSVTGKMNDALCRLGPKLSVVVEYGSDAADPSLFTSAQEEKRVEL